MGALFPGYLKELSYAGFVPSTLDDAIQKRAGCRHEPVGNYMHTEHIDVGPDFSDAQIAETFLHHRVLIVPVVDSGRFVESSRAPTSSAASASASSSANERGRHTGDRARRISPGARLRRRTLRPPMFLVIRATASPIADEGLRSGLGNIGVML
jgi:hypothetical protein